MYSEYVETRLGLSLHGVRNIPVTHRHRVYSDLVQCAEKMCEENSGGGKPNITYKRYAVDSSRNEEKMKQT